MTLYSAADHRICSWTTQKKKWINESVTRISLSNSSLQNNVQLSSIIIIYIYCYTHTRTLNIFDQLWETDGKVRCASYELSTMCHRHTLRLDRHWRRVYRVYASKTGKTLTHFLSVCCDIESKHIECYRRGFMFISSRTNQSCVATAKMHMCKSNCHR